MRALNTAADLGANVDSLARGYIAWQLRRLDIDSAFKRYCFGEDSTWTSCGAPDADDAALALWIELLYRTAGKRRLPAEWKRSADESRHALAALLHSTAKVYRVSTSVPVALFMDNVEVLSALETSAATGAAAVGGDRRPLSRGASRLRAAITRQFWDGRNRRYRVSSQVGDVQDRFYPGDRCPGLPGRFRLRYPGAITANSYPTLASRSRTRLDCGVGQWRRVGAGRRCGDAYGTARSGDPLAGTCRSGQRRGALERGGRSDLPDTQRAGAERGERAPANSLIRSFYLR